MADHIEMQQLISAYFDGELSQSQKESVEQHIKECDSCRRYAQELQKISSSLKKWNDESLSADLEQKINERLRTIKSKEENMNRKMISIGVGTSVVTVVVLAFVFMQTYAQRSLQCRIRDAGQYLAKRSYDLGRADQYEPQYISTGYQIAQANKSSSIQAATQTAPRLETDLAMSRPVDKEEPQEKKLMAGLQSSSEYLKQRGYGVSSQGYPVENKIGQLADAKDLQQIPASKGSSLGDRSQYESYYLETDYNSQRRASVNEGYKRTDPFPSGNINSTLLSDETAATDAVGYRSREIGGFQREGQLAKAPATSNVTMNSQVMNVQQEFWGGSSSSLRGSSSGVAGTKNLNGELASAGRDYEKYQQNFPAKEIVHEPPPPPMQSSQPAGYGGEYERGPSGYQDDQLKKGMMYTQSYTANTEDYDRRLENPFLNSWDDPLSTFSIDVDKASYANVRRFINEGQLPPPEAVRIEELINYFNYDYPQPHWWDAPFTITTEVSRCPWNQDHHLVLIGLQGKKIDNNYIPPSNFVFLIDVSGSMDQPNKLPLLKASFKSFVKELRSNDRVSIVVYADRASVILDSTPGYDQDRILSAIDSLSPGGSTAGGDGIQLAYRIAQDHFIPSGNNRVILATDGDFNVGVSSDEELVNLIEEKRNQGVFLTVLGLGTGNLKDSKMEKLADHGNGNYAYLDNVIEGEKILINEMSATLLTIAKDVKIQVEFNPAKVKYYRLIGYENRLLAKEDFNNDYKDAGDIGAGHSVTALYEIVLADSREGRSGSPSVDPLKYQDQGEFGQGRIIPSVDLMTVKLRYKEPKSISLIPSQTYRYNGPQEESKLLTRVIKERDIQSSPRSNHFKFASAVAEFGLLLKHSYCPEGVSYDGVLKRVQESLGKDAQGERVEFFRLVKMARFLAESR